MNRWPVLLAAVALGTAGTAAASGPAASEHGGPSRYYGVAYFPVFCNFSHRNQDDPIVFPNHPGRSHDHTFFGNTSTNARSTVGSLRQAGTTCRVTADRAAYWAPTLFVAGKPVEPAQMVAYYVRRTHEPVRAFPRGLKMIAGNAAARSPQSLRIVSWSCGREVSSSIPSCDSFGFRRATLRLQVNFPSCWDGVHLDSADHKSHMAYATSGVCPSSHPVAVPGLTLVIAYPVTGGANAELASGGQLSGHADFVNAWDQETLSALVDRYLNRFR